jgi:hypothetical protein
MHQYKIVSFTLSILNLALAAALVVVWEIYEVRGDVMMATIPRSGASLKLKTASSRLTSLLVVIGQASHRHDWDLALHFSAPCRSQRLLHVIGRACTPASSRVIGRADISAGSMGGLL